MTLVNNLPTLALCTATECCRIPEHIAQADFCPQGELIIANFSVNNGASSLVYPTDDVAYSQVRCQQASNKGVYMP